MWLKMIDLNNLFGSKIIKGQNGGQMGNEKNI